MCDSDSHSFIHTCIIIYIYWESSTQLHAGGWGIIGRGEQVYSGIPSTKNFKLMISKFDWPYFKKPPPPQTQYISLGLPLLYFLIDTGKKPHALQWMQLKSTWQAMYMYTIFYCIRSYIKYLATVVHCFSAVTLIMRIVFILQIFQNHHQPMIVIFCKISKSNMCSRIKSISMQTFLFLSFYC